VEEAMKRNPKHPRARREVGRPSGRKKKGEAASGALRAEAARIQYAIRAGFFYRRRTEFKRLIEEVKRIDSGQYDWSNPEALGITEKAWRIVRDRAIPFCRVFCHPDLIRECPQLIAYYRSIAVLPQKGIQRLAFGVQALEEGRGSPLSKERALRLAMIFNTYVGMLVEADPEFTVEDLWLAGAMNFGAQINGSWRGEIGREGIRRVRELLLRDFLDRDLIREVILRDDTYRPPQNILADVPVDDIRGFTVGNGYRVLFGSEPDISIFDPGGTLVGAVEVKAGLDPAGALERYGAAKKSFARVLERNRGAETIYLASVITDGVREAMDHDILVKRDFNLTEVLTNDEARKGFLAHIRWLMRVNPKP
jgi:hypothetical protein